MARQVPRVWELGTFFKVCDLPSSIVMATTLGLSTQPTEVQASTEKVYDEKGRSPVTLNSRNEGDTPARIEPFWSTV